MPSATNITDNSSLVFRRNFLEAGGLKYVIDIFQSSTFPPNTNIIIIQDCYVVALSLTKFLLCAPPTSGATHGGVEIIDEGKEAIEEQPSSMPSSVPSLVCRQMSKTKSVDDEMARLTIEVRIKLLVHLHVNRQH